LAGLCAGLAGCPGAPVLTVNPAALDFGAVAGRDSFTVFNAGGGELVWSVTEVVWAGPALGWEPQDVPWLSVDPADVAGGTTVETDRVFLDADRTGLEAGMYQGAGLQVASNGGRITIPVALTVPTTDPGDPGEGDLKASPNDVTINGLGDTATFTVSNSGDALVHWYAEVVINESGADPAAPVQVGVAPGEAVTAPGAETDVTAAVTDTAGFDTEILNYLVNLRDRTTNVLLDQVIVTVDLVGEPVIYVEPSLLDFGEEGFQLSFIVVNIGDPNSILDFAIFAADGEDFVPYDLDADPLVAAVSATEGMMGVQGHPNDPWINAREVSVTISRDGIVDDLELRELWVGAVRDFDGTGQPLIDGEITPEAVQLRVAASPVVEGAINRSRPPSIMKFVFLLRDKRGNASDASDELVRNQISFLVDEDEFPLDPDESNLFISGPERLRNSLVVLLDYTGSMYRAGVDDPLNPLAPGEAIAHMKEAAKQLILDLPDSYRIAVMEYHSRQQPSRIIHGFDTNKEALLADLDAFSLPEPEHGASEVFDALADAVDLLVNDDPAHLLPFDEADVRSIAFVSDGWDTSSVTTDAELIDTAEDLRVRLYPIGFSGRLSNPVNNGVLIKLAQDTGGHAYYAGELNDLARVLGQEDGLAFGPTAIDADAGTATLQLRNLGNTTLTWQALEALDWLRLSASSGPIPAVSLNPQGVIVEPGVRDLVISLEPGLAAGAYAGAVAVTSSAGDATVQVSATVFGGGTPPELTVTPHTTDAGRLWRELRGQVVLTYTSLFQDGNHTYNIQATFPDSLGEPTSAAFEKDGIFWPGDERAGQLSLSTTGIQDGTAEVVCRTDYVPRNITQFRLRFILDVPAALTPDLTREEREDLLAQLKADLDSGAVTVAEDGLVTAWRSIPEGNGVFTLVTEPSDYLQFGGFGDLLRLRLEGLGPDDAFTVGFRADNTLYAEPGLAKYFLYPGGHLNPEEVLQVAEGSDVAEPARDVFDFAEPFDPEEPGAWDRDGDSWDDFDDADPDDDEVGDADEDGTPDLDDPAPDDPGIP